MSGGNVTGSCAPIARMNQPRSRIHHPEKPMPRLLRTQAIVLNREEAGESHRLITLLTKDFGKLKVFAPGARRSKRRFAGCLELFAHIEISAVDRSVGKLPSLEEAVLLDPHEPIKSNLLAIAHAGYVSELASAMLGECDEAVDIYNLLVDALAALDRGPMQSFDIRRFELAVLAYAGFAPHLSSCLQCGTENAGSWKFDFIQGGVICSNCEPSPESRPLELSSQALNLLRSIEAGERPPEGVDSHKMHAARNILAMIIDNHVEKPLKAREFLYQLAKKPK